MRLHLLKSKIHNAIVTSGDLEYEGSVSKHISSKANGDPVKYS